MANDFRFQLRGGASAPEIKENPNEEEKKQNDTILREKELGYADNGIIYSVRNNKRTIVAQELNYGTTLPATGTAGQIFYALEESPYLSTDIQNAEESSF